MTPNTPDDVLKERVLEAATEAVRDADIRRKVHEVTLLALRDRHFDRRGIREVIRAVTEGIALGADKSRTDMRQAISEALTGLDEALRNSAEAGYAALKQLTTTTQDFSDAELKQALADMRRLEEDFLATVGQVADKASARVQPQLRDALSTARRTGTATGKQVAMVMTEFAHRFSVASVDATIAGLEAAGQVGQRFAMLASGIIGGMAEALRGAPPKEPRQES